MIAVTDAMADAWQNAWSEGCDIKQGLGAVLMLIDPVPNTVRKARIVRSDWEFTRIMAGEDRDVYTDLYRSECGCHYYTYRQIMDAAAEEDSEVEWS